MWRSSNVVKKVRSKRVIVLEDRSRASFSVGQHIPKSGVYEVRHAGHRNAHEVTLLAGELFPRCNVCGADVSFSLLESAPALDAQSGFRVKLYEIPHPNDTEDPALSAQPA